MNEIRQELGFDATKALDTLARLDTAMAKLQSRMDAFAQSASNFNRAAGALDKAGKATAGSLATAATAANNFGAAVNKTTRGVTKDTERMTTSFGLLSRVVYTQAIVRALSTLRNAFRDTGAAAVEFQKRISLIRTIDDSGASFNKVADAARRLSDELNIDLLQTADGLYQSISNQVGEFGESLAFTAKSAEFAKATNSSLADSVDLLSGALKSYNLGVEETDRVSSIFFKTIDLGRITASELSNSFGRIGPQAASLGVSLEEVASALSAISVRGTNTSESITQLRGILSSLQKPSEAMTARLAEMGFTSSETAIRTRGLGGILADLERSTGGSAEQLAKLFPNVRALSGELALTNDELKSFSSNLTEMNGVSADFSRQKFLTATANEASKVTKELNKLRNAFTTDLGQSVLRAAAGLSEFVGGADELVKVIKVSGPALAGMAGSFALIRAQAAFAKTEVRALNAALTGLALAPLAAGLGSSIGQGIEQRRLENARSSLDSLSKTNADALANFTASQNEQTAVAQRARDEQVRIALSAVQRLNAAYIRDTRNAELANDSLVANTKSALDSIVGARERLVSELARAAADSRSIAEQSVNRVFDLQSTLDSRAFQDSIRGLSEADAALATVNRAQLLAAKAASDMTRAAQVGDKVAIDRAIALFYQAEGLASQVGAANALNAITNKQLAAERSLQAIQVDRAAKLDAERVKQQKLTDQLREQAKIVLANTGQGDAGARQGALRRIAELSLSRSDLDATSALGLADFISRFQNELSRDPVHLQFAVEEGAARIQADLQRAFANFRLGVNVEPLEAALGRSFSSPDQFAQGLAEATEKAKQYEVAINKVAAAQQRAEQLRAELDTVFAGIDGRGSRRSHAADGRDKILSAELSGIVAELQRLRSAAEITDQELSNIFARSERFNRAVQGEGAGARSRFGIDANELATALRLLHQLDTVSDAAGANTSTMRSEAERLNSAINAAANAGDRFADSMQRAAAASATVSPQGRQFGGSIYRAAGGPVGTDTIPAMLSPGEFVVNAQSSRKFFSQLQAINAGSAPPVYRSEGGSVTNNVGDIHVSVGGSNATPREIAVSIQRELRRGTTPRFR